MNERELKKKAIDFASQSAKISGEDYLLMRNEMDEATEKYARGEISLKDAQDIIDKHTEEIEKTIIKFDDKEVFKKFIKILIQIQAVRADRVRKTLKAVKHEIEHSKPYEEAGIKSYFGLNNFSDQIVPFHEPFGENFDRLSHLEKAKLLYKSLKGVSDLSNSDIARMAHLERLYGDQLLDARE